MQLARATRKLLTLYCLGESPDIPDQLITQGGISIPVSRLLAFGTMPDFDSKTLLLETPHNLVTGYVKIKLKLTGKLPLYWPVFIVP